VTGPLPATSHVAVADNAHAHDNVEKPFDPATLEALIDRQLAALGVLAR